MMDVSIIIINYNTLELTRKCLKSVIKFTAGITYEIIAVDNGSKKENLRSLEGDFPQVKFLYSADNLGFAGGNNLGIAQATGESILLLNSDAVLVENSILLLHSYLQKHPHVGVVSPRLIFPDGKHQSVAQRFPSIKYSLIELLRLQKFVPAKQAGRVLLGAFFDHKETLKADWVWGTCFIFRKLLLPLLPEKKLDDKYFMYFEDMQWCMDIGNLGYEIHFFANTEVVHLSGGSSATKSRLMMENGKLFMRRNYMPIEIYVISLLNSLLR